MSWNLSSAGQVAALERQNSGSVSGFLFVFCCLVVSLLVSLQLKSLSWGLGSRCKDSRLTQAGFSGGVFFLCEYHFRLGISKCNKMSYPSPRIIINQLKQGC